MSTSTEDAFRIPTHLDLRLGDEFHLRPEDFPGTELEQSVLASEDTPGKAFEEEEKEEEGIVTVSTSP